jgi:hypothetical protein
MLLTRNRCRLPDVQSHETFWDLSKLSYIDILVIFLTMDASNATLSMTRCNKECVAARTYIRLCNMAQLLSVNVQIVGLSMTGFLINRAATSRFGGQTVRIAAGHPPHYGSTLPFEYVYGRRSAGSARDTHIRSTAGERTPLLKPSTKNTRIYGQLFSRSMPSKSHYSS